MRSSPCPVSWWGWWTEASASSASSWLRSMWGSHTGPWLVRKKTQKQSCQVSFYMTLLSTAAKLVLRLWVEESNNERICHLPLLCHFRLDVVIKPVIFSSPLDWLCVLLQGRCPVWYLRSASPCLAFWAITSSRGGAWPRRPTRPVSWSSCCLCECEPPPASREN